MPIVYVTTCPDTWVPGIKFCSKRILRTGIILYGFKLTFQDVMAVGFSAIVMDAIIVCGTIGLGILVGRLLKIDRSIALLTACGSAVCGAAAVLGINGAIRPKPYKTAVAVARRSSSLKHCPCLLYLLSTGLASLTYHQI